MLGLGLDTTRKEFEILLADMRKSFRNRLSEIEEPEFV